MVKKKHLEVEDQIHEKIKDYSDKTGIDMQKITGEIIRESPRYHRIIKELSD